MVCLDERTLSILLRPFVPEHEDSIWIFSLEAFLLFFPERRKSNVEGRTERLKGEVNGSISAVGRQQNTKWNSHGKTHAAKISRISHEREGQINLGGKKRERKKHSFIYRNNQFIQDICYSAENNLQILTFLSR